MQMVATPTLSYYIYLNHDECCIAVNNIKTKQQKKVNDDQIINLNASEIRGQYITYKDRSFRNISAQQMLVYT